MDDGKITHLMRVRLKMLLYDFFGAVLASLFFTPLGPGPFSFPALLAGEGLGTYRSGGGFVNSSFSTFRSVPPRKNKIQFEFWPVRVDEKPYFCYVPSTFFANFTAITSGFGHSLCNLNKECPKTPEDVI